MRAITYGEYGDADVLRIDDVEVPVPAADELLVKVHAASLNPYDWHFMTGLPYFSRVQFGLRGPKSNRLGADLAGTVAAVGADVTCFRPGDEVFGGVESGSLAEYVAVPESCVAIKPSNTTFGQAAATPMAALTAMQGMREKGGLRPGCAVLINGASGGVGTFAVQIAKSFGAEVTGVCSTSNVELVRSIGADHVIDYTRDDFTSGGPQYDLTLDNIGNRPTSACRSVLREKGIYVASFGRPENRWLGPIPRLLAMMLRSPFVSQKMVTFVARTTTDELATVARLIENGEVTPVIDETYALDGTADAMRHLAGGHARGKIVVMV